MTLADMLTVGLCLIGVILLMVVLLLAKGVVIVKPWETALLIRLGTYKRALRPGFHVIMPFISHVIRVDMREQMYDVPRQEVITKDNSPTNVDAVIYLKAVDPEKAIFNVQNYVTATVALAQTSLRSIIGLMELDDLLFNRERINIDLRDIIDVATDPWGVQVTKVEIRELDPVGSVKEAMEEQTASERKRRAAILIADGDRRSAILVAEGSKRSNILTAEGERQAQVLRAEGERLARILRAQGEAQRLRILSLGSVPLDQKSLTVLSLDTLAKVANGRSTKIIFPFEISKMIEGVSEYLGASQTTREHSVHELKDLETQIGSSEDILGTIPKPEEIQALLEREMSDEVAETETMVQSGKAEEPSGSPEDAMKVFHDKVKKPR